MNTRSLLRKLFARQSRPAPARPRPRTRLSLEALEDRTVPTIDLNVVVGGTLDVNPVSSIFPGAYTRMDVLTTTVPGLSHGTMYKVAGSNAYPWGSGPPNTFAPAAEPSANQNRITGSQGFRYVNNGTGLGTTESIPVMFTDGFGNNLNDTLVIHINSPVDAPTITSQPASLVTIAPGQSATMSVEATGAGPLSYQWYNGLSPDASRPIAGATSSTYTTPVMTALGQTLYWVKVKNAGGEVNSQNTTVNVVPPTTTTTSNRTTTYSTSSQLITLNATVTRVGNPVNTGIVTFTVPGVGTATSSTVTNNAATATLTIPAGTHAGTYTIQAQYDGQGGLVNSSDNSKTLTINKANQTISGFGALAARTYGADFTIAGVSATSGSDAGGVTFASLNPSVAVVSGTTVRIVGAGTAVIVASQAGNQDWNAAPNVSQTLTVNKAPLEVTAAAATKVYGQANPAFTALYVGLVNGDTSNSLSGTLSFSTPATAASPVGNYPITPSGLTSNNYDIRFSNGTLTVAPAPLLVTAADATRVYGQPNPAFTVSYSGFVNGDTASSLGGSLTVSTSATAGSPVGTYVITPSGLSGNNYTITFVNGTLTVTPASLTITPAANQSKVYGAAVPALTYAASGLVNGDPASTITGSLGTTATAASPVGSYAFTLGTLNAGPNYFLALTADAPTFAVTPATPVITWTNPGAIVYGTALGAAQLNARADVAGTFTYSPSAGTVLDAGSHTLSVAFAPDDAANYNATTATVTLLVQQAVVAVGDVSIVEGNAGTSSAVFTVTLTGGGQPVTVQYATANGTATAGIDYTAASGTLTFAPGTSTQTISVAVHGDALGERHETFFLNLTGAVGTVVADGQGLGTVLNDDADLRLGDGAVVEGNGPATSLLLPVTLNFASALPVTVAYGTADNTAQSPADYTAAAGTLTFAPGETRKFLTVAVAGDAMDENSETFRVNLSAAVNAFLADGEGLGTILDDDDPPVLSVGDATVTEGPAGFVNLVFTLSLSAASGKQVSVSFATRDGSAQAANDYVARSGMVIFGAGETVKTVTVQVRGDTLAEADETFFLDLSAVANAALGTASGTGTIGNDDL